jgi:CheY-like chemotaxis protein
VSAPTPADSHAVVLLVQPERDDRQMYAEFLRHAGMTPIVVSNALSALPLARDADVIVTALLLPGHMDGVALIRLLRHDGRTKNIPIIVLTSSAWDTERARAEDAGCDLFLSKPCLPNDLLHGIRRVLASKQIGKTRRRTAKAALPDELDARRKPRPRGR